MQVSIPIYVEAIKSGGTVRHVCRPAFEHHPSVSDEHLGVALQRLRRRLKQQLDQFGQLARHDALAQSLFSPDFESHLLRTIVPSSDSPVPCKLLWLVFPALGRRVAMSPSLADLWIDLPSGSTLPQRVDEVLGKYFREQQRRARRGETAVLPEMVHVAGSAWITTVDLDVNTRQASQKKLARQLAAIFDESKMDGSVELQSVGRCLDWLYPHDLLRGVAREQEVEQLVGLLAAADQRPVVVVGPRLVGKTTVIHEAVRRRVAGRKNPQAHRRNVWLVSPQRLISGMSYVGQWEGRVQAILKHAIRRQHVLYVDDLLGLYHAGVTRDSRLSIADVLKPFLLRREVRLLGEMTPEAWHAFQERDRGLADQFHVLRVAPTSEQETRRVLSEVFRGLESAHGVQFDLAVLPTVLRLHQSYVRDAEFPGKAAAFARQLARKHAGRAIERADVFAEFHARTGLAPALLDDRRRIERSQVVDQLRGQVVGQDEAVEAAADVVVTSKALLADPRRPLATFLCLGPTGVGKTQCAKALAETMFSDASRLIRFDMNEFVTPYAVERLVGTSDEPEGLLTAAVRRQPFCVVLFDEIEKAHPDAYDLLLQVFGEGRLTDPLGRTTDFSNTVLIMTSNLGAAAGAGTLGLTSSTEDVQREHYVRAAEQFFRPEFYNRIDRVIPFGTLGRDEMRRIAELQLSDVLRRDGLVRRRCAVSVDPSAMERIVDAGYHPRFGARALKRAIERQLVQPIAGTLAALRPDVPTLIRVWPSPEGVTTTVHPLDAVPATPPSPWLQLEAAERLAAARRYLARLEASFSAPRPDDAENARGVSRERVRYYAIKEQWRRVRECVANLEERLAAVRKTAARASVRPSAPPQAPSIKEARRAGNSPPEARILRDIQSVQDIHEYFRDVAATASSPPASEEDWLELRNEAAMLHALESSAQASERVLVVIRRLVSENSTFPYWLNGALFVGTQTFGYDVERLAPGIQTDACGWRHFVAAGPGIGTLLAGETGLHMYCRRHENLSPTQVDVIPLADGPLAPQIEPLFRRQVERMEALRLGRTATDDDPFPLGRIVRFYDEGGPTLDLRTGLTFAGTPNVEQWRRLVLAGLPLPPEMEG